MKRIEEGFSSRLHRRWADMHAGAMVGALAGGVVLWAGCSSGPSAIEAPNFDPSGSADEAMELFDKDGDGFIAGAELDETPGIKAAMPTLDADNDGKASAEEIAGRIEAWEARGVGLMGCSFAVTLDGKPLDGATVTFDPEPFLSDVSMQGVGPVNRGTASPTIPKEQRIPADAPAGMRVGLYRVRFSKQVNGTETIPAKFNAETTLGQQVSADDPGIRSQKLKFELKTR